MTEPERPRRVPAEPASPDQLPEQPEDPDLGVSVRKPATDPVRARFTPYTEHYSRVGKRRDRIVEEIERNRRGEAAIPTWVLALTLLALAAAIAAVVVFS